MSLAQRCVHQVFRRPLRVFDFLLHAHDHLWLDKGFTLTERVEGSKILWDLAREQSLWGKGETIDE